MRELRAYKLLPDGIRVHITSLRSTGCRTLTDAAGCGCELHVKSQTDTAPVGNPQVQQLHDSTMVCSAPSSYGGMYSPSLPVATAARSSATPSSTGSYRE